VSKLPLTLHHHYEHISELVTGASIEGVD